MFTTDTSAIKLKSQKAATVTPMVDTGQPRCSRETNQDCLRRCVMGEAMLVLRKALAGLSLGTTVLYFMSVYWVPLVFRSWSWEDKQHLKWVSLGRGREVRQQKDVKLNV